MKKIVILSIGALFPFFASILYFNILDGSEAAKTVYLIAKIAILIYPVLALYILRKKLPQLKDIFAFDFKELMLGVKWGIVLFILGLLSTKIPQIAAIIDIASPHIINKISGFGVANYYIIFAFIISFIHSMLEEYYWRWFLFGELKKIIFLPLAYFLAGLAFSLHHFIVLNFYFPLGVAAIFTFIVMIGGVLFSYLYNRKENIWGAWAMHVFADLVIMYVGWSVIN